MAEPEAVKPTANRRAMHTYVVLAFQFQAQLVQRQIALLIQTSANPAFQAAQLACPTQIALRLRRKPTRLTPKRDHVVHEFRRNQKMTRRLPVPIACVDKRDNPFPQLYRMWLSHHGPLYLLIKRQNHRLRGLGILNLVRRDTR